MSEGKWSSDILDSALGTDHTAITSLLSTADATEQQRKKRAMRIRRNWEAWREAHPGQFGLLRDPSRWDTTEQVGHNIRAAGSASASTSSSRRAVTPFGDCMRQLEEQRFDTKDARRFRLRWKFEEQIVQCIARGTASPRNTSRMQDWCSRDTRRRVIARSHETGRGALEEHHGRQEGIRTARPEDS